MFKIGLVRLGRGCCAAYTASIYVLGHHADITLAQQDKWTTTSGRIEGASGTRPYRPSPPQQMSASLSRDIRWWPQHESEVAADWRLRPANGRAWIS